MTDTPDSALPAWHNRERVVRQWHDTIAHDGRLHGAGVDSSFAAATARQAGVDFMVVNNTGKFRRAGFGLVASLMPYGDANAAVLDLASEVIPGAQRATVLAGLCGVDPFRVCGSLLRAVKAAGYAGVQNFPSVGFLDGRFRQQLERTGLGYAHEVEMFRVAREMGLVGVALAFTRAEAVDMSRAGADAIVFHGGLEIPGDQEPDPREAAKTYRAAMAPALDIRSDLVLMRQSGGEAFNARFLEELSDLVPCHGFFYDYVMNRCSGSSPDGTVQNA